MLDPAGHAPTCHRIATGGAKKPVYTANRKWTESVARELGDLPGRQ